MKFIITPYLFYNKVKKICFSINKEWYDLFSKYKSNLHVITYNNKTKLNKKDKRLSDLTVDEYKNLFKLIDLKKQLLKYGVNLVIYILTETDIRDDKIDNNNYIRNKLRIINIYNTGQKNFHRLYNISLGKKFTNGFIRNGHDVLEISYRDFISQNRNIFQAKNIDKFQNYLVNTSKNYNPDLIFFGHTQNISPETIKEFKNLNDNLIISQWNEDPVMKSLNYSKKNYNW